jgi:hypothetical protein
MSVSGSPWPMNPPIAIDIPLLMQAMASETGTTLFFGIARSFSRWPGPSDEAYHRFGALRCLRPGRGRAFSASA